MKRVYKLLGCAVFLVFSFSFVSSHSLDLEEMGKGVIDNSSIEKIGEEGINGIHIMPNGKVMTGDGFWVKDAVVTEDGMIVLGSGEVVKPVADMRKGQGIRRTKNTMVVNENLEKLPPGCEKISEVKKVHIRAGTEIAKNFPGTMFTYDTHSLQVKPCSLVMVTFENLDNVRHQFMVHNLPPEIYPMGMFNIEITGPGKETGGFIVPAEDITLKVHCGVPTHEAKGMIMQIKVGKGSGDINNLPVEESKRGKYNYDYMFLALGIFVGIGFGALLYHLRYRVLK